MRQRYYVVQELGRSGFSVTYLAEDRDLSPRSNCVIKIIKFENSSTNLNPQSAEWESLQKHFVAEAVTLKRLGKHPQIPQLLDYFEDNWQFYLVEEFIEGDNLEQIVQNGLLSETETINILRDVLKILDFVHQQGVIHQDIQPSNLIRRHQDHKICLIDFGAVEHIPLQSHLNFANVPTQIIGKLGYVPPEQQEGRPNITSDLYALGKTAIYALSSKAPNRVNLQTIELDNLPDDSPQDETIHTLTKISPRLTNILNKMVHQNYEERYQSAIEVLTELEREENVVYLPPPFLLSPPNEDFEEPQTTQPKPKKRKIILWLLLIMPFIAALITFGLGIYKNMYRGFSEYTNSNYQIKIRYPEAWSVKALEDPITGEVVVFYSPKENESDIFLEKIFITVEELPDDINNLNEYVNIILTARIINNPEYNVSISHQEETKLSNQLAQEIVYSRQINNVSVRQLEIYTVSNDRVYILTYIAERSKYYKFLKMAKKTIKSLEIE